MINLILKKISILSVLAFLFVFAPVITESSTSQANATTTSTGNSVGLADEDDANKNAFVKTLCNVFKLATGNGGKAFAAFAIISLGIGFFTGKVSWGLMLGVAAGIAAMFGAPTIVAAISGGDAFECKASDFA